MKSLQGTLNTIVLYKQSHHNLFLYKIDSTTDYGTSYTWDGLFTVDEGHKGQLGQKQHFLGRVAKSTRNIRSYQIWILVNSIGIIFTLVALYMCYFHFDFFHYRLCTVYASLGHADAQHIVGERLLHGRGVEKDQVKLKNILQPLVYTIS